MESKTALITGASAASDMNWRSCSPRITTTGAGGAKRRQLNQVAGELPPAVWGDGEDSGAGFGVGTRWKNLVRSFRG